MSSSETQQSVVVSKRDHEYTLVWEIFRDWGSCWCGQRRYPLPLKFFWYLQARLALFCYTRDLKHQHSKKQNFLFPDVIVGCGLITQILENDPTHLGVNLKCHQVFYGAHWFLKVAASGISLESMIEAVLFGTLKRTESSRMTLNVNSQRPSASGFRSQSFN